MTGVCVFVTLYADPLCTRYMEFVCKNRAQCLFQSLVCDGMRHCADGSDEDPTYAGCCESHCTNLTAHCHVLLESL